MKNWKILLKISVAALLIIWLARSVDWPEVVKIAAGASFPLLLGYITVQILGNLISAAKWQYLARTQGFQFKLRDGFFAYLAGAFINNFLPSTVGGDTYRVLWMSHLGERLRAFSVVFFDRITGLLALFLFAALGLAFLPWSVLLYHPGFIMFAAILFSAAIMILAALFWTERFYALGVFLFGLLPWQKPSAVLRSFEPFAQSGVYARSIGWATLFTLVGIGLSNFLLFSGLGAELSPLAFGSAIFAATLVANIPISINNIGVKEWSYVFFFGLVGVSAELAVTAALTSRILQMLISLIALPQYLRVKKEQHSE